jgi:hypothetical protein
MLLVRLNSSRQDNKVLALEESSQKAKVMGLLPPSPLGVSSQKAKAFLEATVN